MAEGQAYKEKIWDEVGADHVVVLRLERRLNELSEQVTTARGALSVLRKELEAAAIAAVLT